MPPTEHPTPQTKAPALPLRDDEGAGAPPPGVGLEVDVRSPVPPYEQIRAQIAEHITAGRLRHGDRLPSLRALAADLGVAAGTTARAYRELEAGGLVISRRRTGTVVNVSARTRIADADSSITADRAAQGVMEAAAELVHRARGAGWDDAEVLGAVRQALRASAEARRSRATHDLTSTATSA